MWNRSVSVGVDGFTVKYDKGTHFSSPTRVQDPVCKVSGVCIVSDYSTEDVDEDRDDVFETERVTKGLPGPFY